MLINIIYLNITILFLFISYVNSCKWSPNKCGCPKVQPSIQSRIVGGEEAKSHSWPVGLEQYFIVTLSFCYFSGWSVLTHQLVPVVKSKYFIL